MINLILFQFIQNKWRILESSSILKVMFVIITHPSFNLENLYSQLLHKGISRQCKNRFAATGFCSECGNNVYRLVLSSLSLSSLKVGQFLLHPGAGHALDVQHLVGVRNYQTLDLEVAVNLPVLHAQVTRSQSSNKEVGLGDYKTPKQIQITATNIHLVCPRIDKI